MTAVDIQCHMLSTGVKIPSIRTIRRRLKSARLNARRTVKRPYISEKNRRARVKWAKAHIDWAEQEWSKVVWTGEIRFEPFGSDGIMYLCRPPGTLFNIKYHIPTIKHDRVIVHYLGLRLGPRNGSNRPPQWNYESP
jgi:hypothetical protein